MTRRREEEVGGVSPAGRGGANIIGACCGSTPEHIAGVRKVL